MVICIKKLQKFGTVDQKKRMRTIHRFLLFPQKIVEKWGCVLYTGAYYLRVYTVTYFHSLRLEISRHQNCLFKQFVNRHTHYAIFPASAHACMDENVNTKSECAYESDSKSGSGSSSE